LNLRLGNRINGDSRKGAKDEAKPAGSEQRALGSKKANTREQWVKIKHQQEV